MTRRENSQRRRTPIRRSRPLVLVVCGAKCTEPQYFTALRDNLHSPAVDITLAQQAKAPDQVVRYAATFAKRSTKDFDEIWCVVDVDEYDIGSTVQAAREYGIDLAISNPCFELWLLLHHDGCRAALANCTEAAHRRLRRHVLNYNKVRLDFSQFRDGVIKAVARAKELDPSGTRHERNLRRVYGGSSKRSWSKPMADQERIVRPYGDTRGDGMVQLSFTLPVPHGPLAEGAAQQLANRMGIDPAMVVHTHAIGTDFTFAVVYGSCTHVVDLDAVQVVEREFPMLSPAEVNGAVRRTLGRKMVVVGACIGTDAHTVGIDAILNIKGYAGEKGLEYYRELKVINMGAQVTVPELVKRARRERADAVLVSQVVTQRDAHLLNTRELAQAFREAMGQHRPLLVAGGPRFDPRMAGELGVDRVFGRGTTPGEVASYLVHALAARTAA